MLAPSSRKQRAAVTSFALTWKAQRLRKQRSISSALNLANDVGIVLQSYLRRTYDDAVELEIPARIRICKGNIMNRQKSPFRINTTLITTTSA
jgi:hypothetical protein